MEIESSPTALYLRRYSHGAQQPEALQVLEDALIQISQLRISAK